VYNTHSEARRHVLLSGVQTTGRRPRGKGQGARFTWRFPPGLRQLSAGLSEAIGSDRRPARRRRCLRFEDAQSSGGVSAAVGFSARREAFAGSARLHEASPIRAVPPIRATIRQQPIRHRVLTFVLPWTVCTRQGPLPWMTGRRGTPFHRVPTVRAPSMRRTGRYLPWQAPPGCERSGHHRSGNT
jgi:hypothetical protein